ncbi:uncharacterized protein [Euphorbia lathyris]|uniref:uncharacterized protein isoform X2 n=1 Tax=Euphorbia lathyris TaxID=212925 RepID=UPI003313275E
MQVLILMHRFFSTSLVISSFYGILHQVEYFHELSSSIHLIEKGYKRTQNGYPADSGSEVNCPEYSGPSCLLRVMRP